MKTNDYLKYIDLDIAQDDRMFRVNSDTTALGMSLDMMWGKSVLDIGTNNGALLLYAWKKKARRLIGVDIFPEALELAKENVSRYADEDADFRDYGDLVEMIFKKIIPEGKGIELNTSSFKYNMRCTCPSEEILRMYRQMGGEIIVIGSDAHTPDRITDHFDYASEYLKSLGFRYLSTFRHKKPSFVKL